MMMAVHHNKARRRPRRGGFTLVEVLVAITAVIVITVAVGQLFTSVQSLVSTSASVGELDSTARLIQRQFSDDAAGFASLSQEESFLVIRSVELGDVNGNGSLDGGETAIYISEDDRERDERLGISPYAEGSRAITVRFDDVAFLAAEPPLGLYFTNQQAGDESRVASAEIAIVQWGVGLLPAIEEPDSGVDAALDVTDPATFPSRRFYPDGIEPGDPWIEAYGSEFSRNEYARSFPLVRSQLLLAGGLAFGAADDQGTEALAGTRREIAPFALDAFNAVYHGANLGNVLRDPDELEEDEAYQQSFGGFNRSTLARAGLLRHGRTDISAMSPNSLRRFVEGQEDPDRVGEGAGDATPFDGGVLDINDPRSVDPSDFTVDSPLWTRWPRDNSEPLGDQIRIFNAAGVQMALANIINRRLVETEPPAIRRVQSDTLQPEDALTDLSGVIASGCSRFEVAWSDGSRWTRSTELRVAGPDGETDTDDDIVFQEGDIVWFDRDFTFDDYLREIDGSAGARATPLLRAEFTRDELPNSGGLPPYTDEIAAASGGADDGDEEYWAVWGYRTPVSDGGYRGAWIKPELLRVRATLHDKRSRIENGKTYEFIVSLRGR